MPPKFELKLRRHKKKLENLPPQLYQIKIKICHDQGCNDIGVVKATKSRHYLFYFQQYFSALGTVLTKSLTGAFFSNTVDSMFLKLKRNLQERYRDILG